MQRCVFKRAKQRLQKNSDAERASSGMGGSAGAVPADIDLNEKEDEEEGDEDISEEDLMDASSLDEEGDVE